MENKDSITANMVPRVGIFVDVNNIHQSAVSMVFPDECVVDDYKTAENEIIYVFDESLLQHDSRLRLVDASFDPHQFRGASKNARVIAEYGLKVLFDKQTSYTNGKLATAFFLAVSAVVDRDYRFALARFCGVYGSCAVEEYEEYGIFLRRMEMTYGVDLLDLLKKHRTTVTSFVEGAPQTFEDALRMDCEYQALTHGGIETVPLDAVAAFEKIAEKNKDGIAGLSGLSEKDSSSEQLE